MREEKETMFTRNLKKLLTSRGINQSQLAENTGITPQTISNYARGVYRPTEKNTQIIADYFQIEAAELLYGASKIVANDEDVEREFLSRNDKVRSAPFIPVGISAGQPITVDAITSLPKIIVPEEILGEHVNDDSIVFFRANGESMNKVIPNSSLVCMKIDYPVYKLRQGDIVVFSDNYEYSMKRFYDAGDKIIFKPDSHDVTFADIVIPKNERLKIVGKVISYNVVL